MTDTQTKIREAIARLSSAVPEFGSSDQAEKLLEKFLNSQIEFGERINIQFLAAGLMYVSEVENDRGDKSIDEKDFFDYIPMKLTEKRPSKNYLFFMKLVKGLEDENTSKLKKKIKKAYDYKINIMLSLLRYIRMLKVLYLKK